MGGLMVAGRWHSRGRPITYCSPHPATALLEWFVHLELNQDTIPDLVPYIVIDAADTISSERITVDQLSPEWRTDEAVTREIGDSWLKAARSPMLFVPSALVPETENILLNPLHPDLHLADAGKAGVRIIETRDEQFDPRLVKFGPDPTIHVERIRDTSY